MTAYVVTYSLTGGGKGDVGSASTRHGNYHEALAQYFSLINRTRHKIGRERLRTAIITKTRDKDRVFLKWDCTTGAYRILITLERGDDTD